MLKANNQLTLDLILVLLTLLLNSYDSIGQSINVKIKLTNPSNNDTNRVMKVVLISNETCFINLETMYLGLTNSPNEFFLEIADTNYTSLLKDEQGSHGHWFMPTTMLSLEQNDSLFEDIKKRFYEDKTRNELMSSPKMLLLLRNKKYVLYYKLRLKQTTYHNDISTNSSYYKLKKNTKYYLRLKYYSSNKSGQYYKSRKLFHGGFISNYIEFYY